MNQEDGQTTRVERIKKRGMNDYFMPIDLSDISKENIPLWFPDHPLEQFEQIFSDLIVKGRLYPRKARKTFNQYLNQTGIICKMCTSNEVSKCLKCRVGEFQFQWYRILGQADAYDDEPEADTYNLFRRFWGVWNNRWHWKQRALETRKCFDSLLWDLANESKESQTKKELFTRYTLYAARQITPLWRLNEHGCRKL